MGTVVENHAQLQVAAIEVDGILDDLAATVGRLPRDLRVSGLSAMADLERLRDKLVERGTPDWPVDHEEGE